jgi:S1-C subfamily serine protease
MLARTLSPLISFLILTPYGLVAMAQRPVSPPKEQTVKVTPGQPGKTQRAPQVVTVVHRLNGLQMFRLLSRSEQEVRAISGFESGFDLLEDVHTNVIAGLTLDDEGTIAAWLPEADVEFGDFGWSPLAAPAVKAEREARERASRQPKPFGVGLFSTPDITVFGADGKPMAAKYVGVDGATGLSILKLANKETPVVQPSTPEQVNVGQSVRLFGPEPAKSSPSPSRGLYVRVGVTSAEVRVVMRGPAGVVSRFKVSSPRLSQANIGGVVLDADGSTIGIVDGVDGSEASILPTALIRLAANRVLEQQRSVPRPWLGVSGEAVNSLTMDRLLTHGWEAKRARELTSEHKGIVLTSITPGSPAEEAKLQAGDVILKINDRFVANPEDFNWFFQQMGPQRSLSFTLARPDRITEELISVELSRRAPVRAIGLRSRNPLASRGVETIELRTPVATRLGAANAGLLVVFVQPGSPAFNSGLLPGDVIESINGKPVSVSAPRINSEGAKLTLSVVRQMQKLELTLEDPANKN